MSDIRHDVVRTSLMRLDARADAGPHRRHLGGARGADAGDVRERAGRRGRRAPRAPGGHALPGQEHTVTVPIPDGAARRDDARRRCGAASTTRTSVSTRSGSTCPAELVTFRLTRRTARCAKPPLREIAPAATATPARTGSRVDRLRRARPGRGGRLRPGGARRRAPRSTGPPRSRRPRRRRSCRPACTATVDRLRQHHRPHRSLRMQTEQDDAATRSRSRSSRTRLAAVGDEMFVDAAAHLDEPDHLRGARLRDRADRRERRGWSRRARA